MRHLSVLILLLLNSVLTAQNNETKVLESQLKSATIDSVRAELLNRLSFEVQNNDAQLSFDYAKQALLLSEQIDFLGGQAYAYSNIGNYYYNKSDYETALWYYRKSLKVRIASGDKEGQAKALLGIGNAYLAFGDYDKSLSYYLRSLKIFEDLKSDALGDCLFNIGAIYFYQQKFDQAIENWKKAEVYYRAKNDPASLINCLGNIGVVYGEQKKYEEALNYFNDELELSIKVGDKNFIAASHLNIGSVYVDQQKYEAALKENEMALAMFKELGVLDEIAILLSNNAEIYTNIKEYDKAEDCLNEALSISRKIKSKQKIKECYEHLSKLYASQKDFEKAYSTFILLAQMKDSLLNEESSRQINEMQTKYDTRKKQEENELLRQKTENQELSINRQKLINIFILIGLILTLALLFFIIRGYNQKKTANKLLQEKNHIIEVHQKEIIDSISYAKRIQEAILPPFDLVQTIFPQSFILYRPKDIVAGDFYWVEQINDTIFIAVADCTGHGVPAAMISVVCSNALNRAVKEFGMKHPGEILNKVTDLVLETFEKSTSNVNDGMDISLLTYHPSSRKIEWSGANNPLLYSQNSVLKEINPDKQPIGKSDRRIPFTTHVLENFTGDTFYLFTDGYSDQFGGTHGKKFKYKKFKESLSNLNDKLMNEQGHLLAAIFEKWKGDLEQVDDVCVIGIKL